MHCWSMLRTVLILLVLTAMPTTGAVAQSTHDIVIYGGTSAGLVAGIQARAMGKTAVVIEPTQRAGGLTTGGLGQTDIGNKNVIGGLSREFYRRMATHYESPDAWKWQERGDYGSLPSAGEDTMWKFEPSAALRVYRDWIEEAGLEVVYGERLERAAGVVMENGRIVAITMESGRRFAGKMFIDATYEGDLVAAAGVSYTVGREANAQYGENFNGVQTKNAVSHNFVPGVDPYVVPGDPSSGLLPFLDPEGPGIEGSADNRVQAYCYRMCLTNHPENRIPFEKPAGYNEQWYELLFRNFEAGETQVPWINSGMPNRKTDTNNKHGFSTDFIGQNYAYPDASYAERDAIAARHLLYQQGLMWTLAYHPRIPEAIRAEVSRWGLCKDEFAEGGGWQEQLYVREARRMISGFVMTERHCLQIEPVADPVGMGAYTMDSHNVQRYVDAKGQARNEGDIQKGGFPPYPISYRAIVPKAGECGNLLVPVCLSSSHIGFGSIRMEPVFMVLGQSAATAASLAIDANAPVQDVDYPALRQHLEADGQILEYTPPGPKVSLNLVPADRVEGIVVDDVEASFEGTWTRSNVMSGIGLGYHHDADARDGKARVTFSTKLPTPGSYDVQVAYTAMANRASHVPVTIHHRGGDATVKLNQREKPAKDRFFQSVGVFEFDTEASVTMTNAGTDGHVIADAVRFVPAEKKAAARLPSVVLILCDNLGYGDVGCFNPDAKQATPRIGQMAAEGLKFTDCYAAAPVCTPSRAALMTGCYPRRVGLDYTDTDGHVLRPGSHRGLNPEEVTVAELLHGAGYATACIGKWHLGDQTPFLPTRQGFDEYFGIPYSEDMVARESRPGWPPLPLMEGERVIEAPVDRNSLTKRYTERAMAFIERNRDRPFFLYLPHAMPGSTAAPFASAAFRGASGKGPWGDAVAELDWSTGAILDTLARLGLDENTLVIWTNDNGAPGTAQRGGSNLPLKGGRVQHGRSRGFPCYRLAPPFSGRAGRS